MISLSFCTNTFVVFLRKIVIVEVKCKSLLNIENNKTRKFVFVSLLLDTMTSKHSYSLQVKA